jgi:hypothetical protein
MLVTVQTPLVEAIWTGEGNRINLNRPLTCQLNSFASEHPPRNASAIDLQAAAVYEDDRAAAICIGIYSICPLVEERESPVGGVNFNVVTRLESENRDAQRSLIQTELHDVVIQIGHRQVGLAGQADRVRSDFELCACIAIGVDPISGGHCKIQRSFGPLILAGGQKRDITSQVADASSTSGRILLAKTCPR